MFSKKQLEYRKLSTRRWNIKTGATRSGKTYGDYFIIPKRIRACKNNGLIVILGNTGTTIKRNILEPMRNIYGSGLVPDIVSSDGTIKLFGKKVYIIGAEKKSQVSKIQGAGIEYVYGDEITTWSEDVFQMLKSRLDKPNSTFDGTCNPDNPNHWFKKFLDSDADIYHQHYTLYDNPFNTKEFISELEKEYRGTVYFDRYILGNWVAAQGAIYPKFTENKNTVVGAKFDPKDILYVKIGIDFGGNKSASTFVAVGYTKQHKQVVVLDEEHRPAAVEDPDSLNDGWIKFLKRVIEKYPCVRYAYADSAEQVLIRGLKKATKKAGLPVLVQNAQKGMIINRIRLTNMLISQNRLVVMPHCKHLIKSFGDAVWDDKKIEDERLDDGTFNVDILDAFEYALETEATNLERAVFNG